MSTAGLCPSEDPFNPSVSDCKSHASSGNSCGWLLVGKERVHHVYQDDPNHLLYYWGPRSIGDKTEVWVATNCPVARVTSAI